MPIEDFKMTPIEEMLTIEKMMIIEEVKNPTVLRLRPMRDLWVLLGLVLIGTILVAFIFDFTLVGNIGLYLLAIVAVRLILDVLFHEIVCYESELQYTDFLNRKKKLDFSDILYVELRDAVLNKWDPYRRERDIQYATIHLGERKIFKLNSDQRDYHPFMKVLKENGVRFTQRYPLFGD